MTGFNRILPCLSKTILLLLIGVIGPGGAAEAVQEKPVSQNDSAAATVETRDTITATDTIGKLKYNPVIAGVCSAVLPGSGLIYGRHYVKGGLFMAAEAGLGYYSWFWYDQAQRTRPAAGRLKGTAQLTRDYYYVETSYGRTDTVSLSAVYSMKADSVMHEYNKQYAVFSQGLCWAAGCYIYNIMDAVEKSGCLYSAEKRDPRMAGWLSAVPFLAMGQLYNGKFSKAGMIIMTQTSLALMALNSNRLMTDAERSIDRYRANTSREQAVARHAPSLAEFWNRQRSEAFRDRNMFLWYSLFFYLYGVFDAVVDAHLHDYDARMRLEPDLQPRTGAVGLRGTVDY